MKKTFFTILLGITAGLTAQAQKYCYVNTEYILENIPEYKSAMKQLDQISVNWQKEIEAKYAFIDKLYKDYQAEQILLTEEMRKKREQEIVNKEKEAKDLQKLHFGYEGDLFKKKQELIKPIQDKIYNAIKKMAEEQHYAVVFDKSSDLIMLYANAKYDKSDDILLQMGYKAGNLESEKSGGDTGKTGGAPSRTTTNPQERPTQPARETGGGDTDRK